KWEAYKDYSQTNLPTISQAHHLAYVIYTSGSTGKPKGVMIEQNTICNRLLWWQDYIPLNTHDKYLHQFSFGFDGAVVSLWWPLLNGAILLLPTTEGLRDIDYLIDLILSQKINLLMSTPSIMAIILDSPLIQKAEHIQKIMLAGESFYTEVLEKINKIKNINVYNFYGPTETTIIATKYNATTQKIITATVPIGKPVSNVKVYILNPSLMPVSIGIIGELYIGGEGLARGYLNNPKLSQERFIDNPYVSDADKSLGKNLKLYKTGDICRWLADGNIEYIGRIDDQVKIRGFRIELGEIETVLLNYPLVKEALMMVREEEGDKRLVAYVVAKELNLKLEDLKIHLKQSLPPYMIPSAFVILDHFPLTPNGKVDKKALPAPDYAGNINKFVEPKTENEKKLAEIWQTVLKIDKVGINDNFFDLGGHSLLATQVISRICSNLQKDISLKEFFAGPTIYELSLLFTNTNNQTISSPLLKPIPRTQSLPLSFGQQRLWFIDQLAGNTAAYNIPLVLKLSGHLEVNLLEHALNSLISRHEILRTHFKGESGETYQTITSELNINLDVFDLSEVLNPNASAKDIIAKHTLEPFNLEKGPLIRASLLKLSSEDFIFILTIHHIISDGWSMKIIVDELSELYNAQLENRVAKLQDLPIQYADFAYWQKAYLIEKSPIYQRQLSYWLNELAGAPTLLSLPLDYPRPPKQSFKGAHLAFNISPNLLEQLKVLSKRYNVTLYMVLLSTFYSLLYRYTNQEEIIIGTPIANRNHHDIEGLIGFFVNTLALKASFSIDMSFEALLEQIKIKSLEAYDHQDLPFEKLIEGLKLQRSLAYDPLFQVMFVLQNAGEASSLNLKSVQSQSLAFDYPLSKFDLTLNILEQDGLQAYFEYATDLFKASTIEAMVEHFKILLEALVVNPHQAINKINLLTPFEQQQILIDWNNTEKSYDTDKTLQALFEAQVVKTPNHPAIIFEGETLSYSLLNQKANQLAHYLREQGVGPDNIIGIICERSFDIVIGILAILKAGGAYLPLDPSYPIERLAYMLEDSQTPLVLTQSSLMNHLPKTKAHIVLLDKWEAYKDYSQTNLPTISQAHHLAYVIYTSGSTGKPKGVMIE
ncbi:MAG: amino acid adenylation domain protein, partial [Francisellaceae bacterium]|nr:amino acid adenylation domain protein [Francisellaceae bacterium]